MNRKRLIALAAGTVLSLAASVAHATVFLGLQQDAGPIVTVAVSPSGFADFDGAFGQFDFVSVDVLGQPLEPLPALLDGTAIVLNNAGAPNAGLFTIYVTSTDNTFPLGPLSFTSSFAMNNLTAGWIETLETYVDSANGVFALTTLLGSETFTFTGADVDTTTGLVTTPYSITGVYRITAPTLGRTNGGLTVGATPVTTVPEPVTLVLLGAAMTGIGLIARRRAA